MNTTQRGVLGGVKQAIMAAYPLLAMMLPPIRFIPIDAIFGVIDAIETGHACQLKPDLNVRDWRAMMRLFKEVGEAGVIHNEKERREAIYAMLVYVTNVEDHCTLEQFMEMSV